MGPSFVIWVHELVFRELVPAPFSEDFLSSRVMFAKKNMGFGSLVAERSEKKREHSLNDRFYNNGRTRIKVKITLLQGTNWDTIGRLMRTDFSR